MYRLTCRYNNISSSHIYPGLCKNEGLVHDSVRQARCDPDPDRRYRGLLQTRPYTHQSSQEAELEHAMLAPSETTRPVGHILLIRLISLCRVGLIWALWCLFKVIPQNKAQYIYEPVGAHIPLKVKDKIWRGEFVDLNLLLKIGHEIENEAGSDWVIRHGELTFTFASRQPHPRSTFYVYSWSKACYFNF